MSRHCAIILGAAVTAEKPSAVFRARIDHSVDLYNEGKVRALIFTGGVGEGDQLSEGEVGAVYATKKGVPSHDIHFEKTSKTTLENLQEAKKIMVASNFDKAFVVSYHLHLRRSLIIARSLGIVAVPSATPYSQYKSWKTKFPFLLREIYFSIHFRLFKQ